LDKSEDQSVNQLKEQYNLVSKGIMAQYSDAIKGTAYVVSWIEAVCDFSEKVRNLV